MRDKIVNIVASPVIFKDKYLLIKRIKEPYFGMWSMVGGKLELGEHIEDAIIREIKEETGLSAEFKSIRGFVNEILKKDKQVDSQYLIWVCETVARSENATEQDEGELSWFSKNELLEREKEIIPSDFAIIKEFFLENTAALKVHKSHMIQNGEKYSLEYFGI